MAGSRPSDPGFGDDEPGHWGRLYMVGERPRRCRRKPAITGATTSCSVTRSRTGSPPPVDPLDAIRGLRVLEAAEASSRMGAVVEPAAV